MTNPNQAIGTPAAYNGRSGVDAFNNDLSLYGSRGVITGWYCLPSSGMTVAIGGTGGRDVAVAEDPAHNFTTISNRIGSAVAVTIPDAPVSNTRIDCIVAYVNNPATVPVSENPNYDNPEACGIIVVSGTAAANPTAPNEAAIRTAISADGGDGSQAYYVILASVQVASGVTTITEGLITQGAAPSIRPRLAGGFADILYPVGSIYMSVSNNSPATIFGGTWERIQDTFLLAAGSTYAAGSTGGEATHTLTKDEMPSHDHSYPVTVDSATPNPTASEVRLGAALSYLGDHYTGSAGSDQAHNNMPPYLAVYVWKRTA